MNSAHFHLIVNHLPSVGVLTGMLILIIGYFLKRPEVKLTALGVFIFSALATFFAYYSGEGAEEVIENMAGISETLIHTHEEYAEYFFTLTLILGAISLIAFVLELLKFKFAKYIILLCLLISISDVVLAKYVGTSGGEIRHSEIRMVAKVIDLNNDHHDHDDDD